jgi:hypothetical protein
MLKTKLIAVAIVVAMCGTSLAQESGCTTCQNGGAVSGGVLSGGIAGGGVQDVPCFENGQFPKRIHSAYNAIQDQYHPHPVYAYSRNGITATREHAWNMNQMESNPWHGNYSYWKYGTPTAVVLPPTAAFITTYQWGVGQTQSNPIHHQFQHQSYGGATAGGGGGTQYRRTPYWPNSTRQFGLYGVRAPW